MPEVEIALQVLFVAFQAMKRSRHRWDMVTMDPQEACMERLTARMRFNDGLPAELAAKVVTQFYTEHPERHLLAYAYGYLGENDLLKVRTDAEKSLLLAALNLVECITSVNAQPARA
ncbi:MULTISPECIES: hypothetical protein [unclassified Variovorax]|uniref:hypothetical protein n=1 Tax=unclassified Variovorax TaxID=663243 RepID=UPI0008CCFC65|nr:MULTISPECIES: hypothetical protein [unclassified Variovorax]SEK16587.1 hypothetical protein SAMN05518853_12759 [Variovorax sp. OK202]SFE53371.1 hypothetical protein SAMN05444746_12759 [Variovorax sp. OK212]